MILQINIFGFLPLFALCILTACGGVLSPTGMTSSNPANIYDKLVTLEGYLGQRVTSEPFTDPRAVLQVGSATYDGVISGTLAGERMQPMNLVGDLKIETNFTDGLQAITGSAHNFVTHDGTRLNGQLKLVDGFLEGNGDPSVDHTVSASLVGTVTIEGTDELFFSLNLEGDFYGFDAFLVAGGANGIVRKNSMGLVFGGRFVAASSTTP
jgi:hypothetical protein